ncbi:MAG: response regulator, partial [Candidatus Competibacteraceae bacterium]|nr:response regulator [Candidatus Competibacteraceae bacterium]
MMDIGMPVMNGIEAAQVIRATPNLADVPIIAVTASADATTREEVIQAGCNECVTKPIEVDRLMVAIR